MQKHTFVCPPLRVQLINVEYLLSNSVMRGNLLLTDALLKYIAISNNELTESLLKVTKDSPTLFDRYTKIKNYIKEQDTSGIDMNSQMDEVKQQIFASVQFRQYQPNNFSLKE